MKKKDDSRSLGDYPVGYGRPPLASRFQPGQSGNRNGRPKGSKSLQAEIQDELNVIVPVTENGTTRKISKKQIIAKQLVNSGAKGDAKGISMLLQNERIAEQAARMFQGPAVDARSPADERIMANIIRRIRQAPQEQDLEAEVPTLIEASDLGDKT